MFDTLTRMGASAAEDYEIEKSLRFNDNDSAYLNRTLAAGTQTKWTFSCWIKLGQVKNSFHAIFSGFTGSTDQYNMIGLDASNRVVFVTQDEGSGGVMNVISSTVLRDTSAWYHIVTTYDSAQATAANRVKGYINGVQCTSFSTETYPAQDKASYINSNNQHNIGKRWMAAYYDGYMADVHFCDNQAYAASSFGKTDGVTGQWIPKKFSGSYGTNGFKLDFSDISNTTAATLGKDSSGNSNNFTPNNFSVATDDEIACDSFSDTPTNNWCIMNVNNNPNGASLHNGGLEVNLVHPHGDNGMYATFGVTSGKWYWEAKCTSAGNRGQVGVTDAGHKSGSNSGYNFSVATRHTGSTSDTSGTSNSHLDAAIGSGDWVTMCFDADNGQIWYSREAAPNISGTANVTGLTLGAGRVWKPHIRETGNPVSNFTFNFGASAAGFKYGPPNADYKPLNAANLPESTIKNGTKYFNTVLYEGTGSLLTSPSVGFQPDLTWVKNRDDTDDQVIQDSERGNKVFTGINDSDVEGDTGGGWITEIADGFTVDANGQANTNNESFVGWCWKEGASNGFTMSTFTPSSGASTYSHGLGVKPDLILLKCRTEAAAWDVYHSSLTADYKLYFSDSVAKIDSGFMNDTEPTSSVFTFDPGSQNGDVHIAYCFVSVAGFSKISSYKGNGDTNGPFVYCGFRPAYLLIKNADRGANWTVYDVKRETINPIDQILEPNINNAEETGHDFDFLSNGFKVRNNNNSFNASNENMVYMAIAEAPFKYANAR